MPTLSLCTSFSALLVVSLQTRSPTSTVCSICPCVCKLPLFHPSTRFKQTRFGRRRSSLRSQVWFQNARAKWRRTVLRQEKGGDSKDLQPLHGEGAGSAAGPGPGGGSGAPLDATVGSAMGYGDMYA